MIVTEEIVIDFFYFLDENGIEYCVVGRSDIIPDNINGDIDIFIPKSVLPNIKKYLNEFCKRHKLLNIKHIPNGQLGHYFVVVLDENWRSPKFLFLDFCGDYFHNGRLLISTKEILSARALSIDDMGKKRGFYIASHPSEFAYYLLKKINKQSLNGDHGDHLSVVWKKDPKGASTQIERYWFGQEAALLKRAAEDNDWNPVRRILPELRRSLHKKLPASPLKILTRSLTRKIQWIAKPPGLHLVFLGTDGSGKSTVIEYTRSTLAGAFAGTRYIHLRPHLGASESTKVSIVVDPHGQPPSNWFVCVLKTAYLLFDYTVGYAVKVLPALARNELIVFDRYYHDLLVDPRRYRYGGPMWLARWIGKLIPKPDLWILLDASPHVLQARKQEVSPKESARQRKAYLALMEKLRNSHVVDASQPLDDVVADVNEIILSHLAERTRRRLGLGDS